MRHTKSKRNRVRSHHALSSYGFVHCSHCRAEVTAHTVCKSCGYYDGREVIDIFAKLDKKERKKRKKELEAEKVAEEHAAAERIS